jgi:hypothetical protein
MERAICFFITYECPPDASWVAKGMSRVSASFLEKKVRMTAEACPSCVRSRVMDSQHRCEND